MPGPLRKLPLVPVACGCLLLTPVWIFAADSLFNALKPKSGGAQSTVSMAGGLLAGGAGLLSGVDDIVPTLELLVPNGFTDTEAKERAGLEKLRAMAEARARAAPPPDAKSPEAPVPLALPQGTPATSPTPSATAETSAASGESRAEAQTFMILLQISSERRRVFSELPEDDTVATLAAIREYHDFKIDKFEKIARLHDGVARKFVDGLIVHYRAQKVMQIAFLEAQMEWLNVLTYERKPTREELARRIEIAEALVAATQEYHTWSENLPGLLDRIESEPPENPQTAEMLRRVVSSFQEENEAQVALLNVNYDVAQTSVRMLKFLRTNYQDWKVVGTLPTFDDDRLESQFDDLMATLKNHLDVAAELEEAALRRAKS
ncbi:MAG: hypothetical protein JSS27_10970 [Planctomycetes bacterium]|nr:hypothetical protein [Planctomycetota bacterium]